SRSTAGASERAARLENPQDPLPGEHFTDAGLGDPVVLAARQHIVEQHDHGPQLAGKLTHVEARQCQQVLVSEALNGAQMIGTRARRQLQQRPDIGAIAGEGESQRALEAIAILGVSGLLGRREGNERAAQLDLFAGELAAQRGGDLVDGALAMAPQPLTAGLAPDLCRRAFEIGDELIGRAAAPPRACLELAEERAAILLREEGMVAAVDVVDPGELFGKPCLYGHTDAPGGGARTGPGTGAVRTVGQASAVLNVAS